MAKIVLLVPALLCAVTLSLLASSDATVKLGYNFPFKKLFKWKKLFHKLPIISPHEIAPLLNMPMQPVHIPYSYTPRPQFNQPFPGWQGRPRQAWPPIPHRMPFPYAQPPRPVQNINPEPIPEVNPQPFPDVYPDPIPEINPEPIREIYSQPARKINPQPNPTIYSQPARKINPQPNPTIYSQPARKINPQPNPTIYSQSARKINPQPNPTIDSETISEADLSPVQEFEPNPVVAPRPNPRWRPQPNPTYSPELLGSGDKDSFYLVDALGKVVEIKKEVASFIMDQINFIREHGLEVEGSLSIRGKPAETTEARTDAFSGEGDEESLDSPTVNDCPEGGCGFDDAQVDEDTSSYNSHDNYSESNKNGATHNSQPRPVYETPPVV